MDIAKVLAHLRAVLEDIEAAIRSLERLQRSGSRRGRPPRWMPEQELPVRSGTRLAAGRSRKATRPAQGHDTPS